ncbi:MAG: hypothetical protein SFY70_02230 [Bacteroidia bacterium]|nr:hypothetical protein [Bacteroidia bacterium]
MRCLWLLPILCVLALPHLRAQTPQPATDGFVSVGINPVYPFLGGYGVRGQYNLPGHWSVGLSAEGGFDLPEFAEEGFFENAGAISVEWDYALGLEATYRFTAGTSDLSGFFAGVAIGFEQWTVTPDPTAAELSDSRFDNWFASLSAGYTWYPTRTSRLWLQGAYSGIWLVSGTQARAVGSTAFRLRSFAASPSITVGWQFRNR